MIFGLSCPAARVCDVSDAAIAATGATAFRVPLTAADLAEPGDRTRLRDALTRLADRFEVLPALDIAAAGDACADVDCARALDRLIALCGDAVRRIELRCLGWDGAGDSRLLAALDAATDRMRAIGIAPVLGGPGTARADRLRRLQAAGVLARVDAVALETPGRSDPDWLARVAEARVEIAALKAGTGVWITDAAAPREATAASGLRHFCAARDAGADRLYWRGAAEAGADANPDRTLVARLLAEGGPERVRSLSEMAAPRTIRRARPVLVTGGSGFIGSNLAESFLSDGHDVVVYDNLERAGVVRNLDGLAARHRDRLHVVPQSLLDRQPLTEAVRDAGAIVHLAGQTAVTTSMTAPIRDFDVNARGTLLLLEAMRRDNPGVPLVFASTNKVYGRLEAVEVAEDGDACAPRDADLARRGIGEDAELSLATPYGCSKGVADQYVLDFARSYGLRTAVLRMSCVYGPNQFGTEDQGWVAHFLLRALENGPITLFGSGRQVRDVLYVDDAVDAYRRVLDRIDAVSGKAFNLGGGPANAVSLLALLREIEAVTGRTVDVRHAPWRPGDQPWFVSDCARLGAATGWAAATGWRDGLARLAAWFTGTADGGTAVERKTA
ncbi:NAD-dependent epimerase/dehydratase family protein [Roseivivax isoporae]|uniref:NAD-dependent epimerase/dehydratase domain-containing protein n=1 Tax=Roseivivax isoporae LMG 25204 TaxID=1449351 RepID=X7F8C3_9RHOB|nr:NAD-dependent epimerase/dehydratase family protein [Roseivivax isoporae]ETX29010.1 hypothetical protein RISW2_03450 [Roseivivax isoporae LMG 25204]